MRTILKNTFFVGFAALLSCILGVLRGHEFVMVIKESMGLMKFYGFKGIPIAIPTSGAINFLILFVNFNSIVSFSYKDIGFSACRAVFVSGIMYLAIKILILQINKIDQKP